MKNIKSNSRLFFVLSFAIIFLALPLISKSQKDTILTSIQGQFEKNLAELNELYCWHETDFYPGKFKMKSVVNIQTEFNSLNFPFFTELNEQAEKFYQFLEKLPIEEKQSFIRYYSFYENEIEAVLKLYGLPNQLKFMAPVLSAMNPSAISFEGKVGIWQLTHFQAVLNGATINKLVDERFNVSISTQVAVRELKKNFELFETPELAIAAFLVGKVKVKNAIQFAKNQYIDSDVFDFFPNSVNEFIAAFQAVAIFLNANRFEVTVEAFVEKIYPDTVTINRQLHFQQVSGVLGISVNELQFLNPQFKYSIVPGNKKSTKLILPNGKRADFVLWQDSIYNTYDSLLFRLVTQKIEYPPAPTRQYLGEPVKDLVIEGKVKLRYLIRTGDVLGIIAEKYDVRVADLKYWNNIYNERKIQAGQKIDIFVDDDKVGFYANLQNRPEKKKVEETIDFVEQIQKSSKLEVLKQPYSSTKIEHVVKSGESPYIIAKKYVGITPDEILEWNNIDDARKIQIGQKLILYLKK